VIANRVPTGSRTCSSRLREVCRADPSPHSAGARPRCPGRAELASIWDGLDQEGRRLLVAQAHAVAEVTGQLQQRGNAGG
jgi:hypothetical protein